MGCNAWNHASNCTCGWGGAGHQGGGWGTRAFTNLIRNGWTVPNNYTTPNAKCPACSAEVFFYQNSSGSKVFFDALGPPWPKHSCTDNYKYDIKRHPRDWQVGVISKVTQAGVSPLRTVHLETASGLKTVFINDRDGLLDEGLPAALFQVNGGFKISAVVPLRQGVQVVAVKAFNRPMDAHKCRGQPSRTQPKVPRRPADAPAPTTSPSAPPSAPNPTELELDLIADMLRSAAKRLNMRPEALAHYMIHRLAD